MVQNLEGTPVVPGSLLEKNRSPFPPERPPSSHGGSESCDGSKLTLGGYDKSLFSRLTLGQGLLNFIPWEALIQNVIRDSGSRFRVA